MTVCSIVLLYSDQSDGNVITISWPIPFPGQLRCWGSRICRHTVGTDHHAVGTGQTHPGQSVQGNDKPLLYLTLLCRLVMKGVVSTWCLNVFFYFIFFYTGKGVPQFQHRPLNQPSFRRLGNPLPPLWNQRYTCSTSCEGIHADAGGASRMNTLIVWFRSLFLYRLLRRSCCFICCQGQG